MTTAWPDAPPVVAVVGGGIAGLAAAWELVRDARDGQRPEVHLLEAGDRWGGKLHATDFAGRTVDLAADAFLARRPEATELVAELGITDRLVPVAAEGADLWVEDRLRPMPEGQVLGVPTQWWPLARSGILSTGGAARAWLDLVRPHRAIRGISGDRAVGEIVRSRLGAEVVERLTDPLVGGIHAGGVDDLSAAATSPLLLAADCQPGSLMRRLGRSRSAAPATPADPARPSTPLFWSLDGGTARLAAELVDALAARGVALDTGARVGSLGRARPGRDGGPNWKLTLGDDRPVLAADGVVLAVPAGEAAGLLSAHAPVAAALLDGIEYSSVAVITLTVPSAGIGTTLRGTGFLVPRTSTVTIGPALITGCTYLGRKWPRLARPGEELIRLSVGRHGDLRAQELDDAELTAAAFAELARVLDISGGPAESMVTRWEQAFPQYPVGHLLRVAQIERSVAELPGLAVAGAPYRGVGIPACVASGRSAAASVLDSLGRRSAPSGARPDGG